jgi:adenylate cyclase, class 2
MHEIEVKIIDIDKDAVIARLEELKASKVFDGEMESLFFRFPDDTSHEPLRLRREGEKVVLCYKKKVDHDSVKVRDEYEVIVECFDAMKELLEALGMEMIDTSKKERLSYCLDNVQVDIDTYSGKYDFIPVFLELEGPSPEAVFAAAEKLGFFQDDCKSWSGFELAKHYKPDGKFIT